MAPTIPTPMPCEPWTTEDKLCCPDETLADNPCTSEDESGPATYAWTDAQLIDIASRILFQRTCFKYPGICEGLTFRPCYECSCPDRGCRCRYVFVPLAGRYPVLEVTEVLIDGAVVPGAAYRLDEYARLVRTDGDIWPRRQNLSADPSTDADTFQVTFTAGRPVPLDLQYAAALLACELKKACNGGLGCRLPDRIRTIVREGVTYEVADINEIIGSGSFQVPELDLILKNYECVHAPIRNRLLHPILDDGVQAYPGVRS